MNHDIYIKKNQYEKLINELNSNYNKLEKIYSNLILCKKKIYNSINVNDNCYHCSELNNIIKIIEDSKNKITNDILPRARYQYNKILLEGSKYNGD